MLKNTPAVIELLGHGSLEARGTEIQAKLIKVSLNGGRFCFEFAGE